jgi:hypothetical protein
MQDFSELPAGDRLGQFQLDSICIKLDSHKSPVPFPGWQLCLRQGQESDQAACWCCLQQVEAHELEVLAGGDQQGLAPGSEALCC